MLDNKEFYSVSEVNQLLSKKIDSDLTFQLMLVVGEIVSFKKHSSGHIYFTLKDDKSRLKCVMFRSKARYLSFNLNNGMEVLVQGRLSIYEKYGEYQLYIDSVHKMGFGDLRQRYLKLKSKLEEKGYFEANIKREIPSYPKKIGVITSSTGAVIHDIIRTVRERFPLCEILLFPANVQGDKALASILNGFEDINKFEIDVIILTRGGGSEEELWTFNEEQLVEKIYKCKIPIITAIGHEVDITLSDLAADLSVATPTAAAMAATPDISQIFRDLDFYEDNAIKLVKKKINHLKQEVKYFENNLRIYEPNHYINHLKNELDLKLQLLTYNINRILNNISNEIKNKENALESIYNRKVTFPKVYNESNEKEINSIEEITLASFVNIIFTDGVVKVKPVEKEGRKYGKNIN